MTVASQCLRRCAGKHVTVEDELVDVEPNGNYSRSGTAKQRVASERARLG